MVAGSACEGVKKTRSDDSDGGSGAASVDVADSRLLLRKVGPDSKVPNDRQSGTGDAGETSDCLKTVRDRLQCNTQASSFKGHGSYQPSHTTPPLT